MKLPGYTENPLMGRQFMLRVDVSTSTHSYSKGEVGKVVRTSHDLFRGGLKGFCVCFPSEDRGHDGDRLWFRVYADIPASATASESVPASKGRFVDAD